MAFPEDYRDMVPNKPVESPFAGGYLSATGSAAAKAGEVGLRLAASPIYAAADVTNKTVNAGNELLGMATGYKFPGSMDTGMTNRNIGEMSTVINEGLQGLGMQSTAAPASATPAVAPKPNPEAAAAKVAARPPTPGQTTGKVKGYLELAGNPASRENLAESGALVPGAVPLSSGATGVDAQAMTNLSDRYAATINATQAPPVVSEPMYGEGGQVLGYRNVIATPENSFQGRSTAEILGPQDSGRAARAASLATLQNEHAKVSQDSTLKQAQGYEAMMRGNKEATEAKYLPDTKKAEIGAKVAEAASKEAEARAKLYPNIEKLMKDGSPADAAWATKAQQGITAGTHVWAPETQFTMLDDAGKSSVPHKMYGTMPASAEGRAAYTALWQKYLGDVKTYNNNFFRTEGDLTALKQNRASFLNGMRSLGLRIDPVQTVGAK